MRTKVHSELEKSWPSHGLSIALIYDVPKKLTRTNEQPFPTDAESEWETAITIEKIADTWQELGHHTIKLPLDHNFLLNWANQHHEFNIVHSLVEGWGSPSREGWIPALCEMSGAAYIGSSPLAQCLAMKKSSFKHLCRAFKIPTPAFYLVLNPIDFENIPDSFLEKPHFIKPDCEGSGMGIDAKHSISAEKDRSRETCLRLLREFPDGVLLEEFLPGRELTSAFIGTIDPLILPIAEIEVNDGVYGLANKSKEAMEEKVTFPTLSKEVEDTIISSMNILRIQIGFEDFVRFDWKLNANGQPHLLEANPLAGLSYYYSVLPKMAYAAGLSYAALLERIGRSAWAKRKHRRFWYGRERLQSESVRNEKP